MVPTAQNRQPRVHSWPAIMNVASPLAQHSWMFGQRASSQTVWSMLSFTAALVLLKAACCSPLGKLVRNQSGKRRFGAGTGLELAMGSCLPVTMLPLYFPQLVDIKKVCELRVCSARPRTAYEPSSITVRCKGRGRTCGAHHRSGATPRCCHGCTFDG